MRGKLAREIRRGCLVCRVGEDASVLGVSVILSTLFYQVGDSFCWKSGKFTPHFWAQVNEFLHP
jgi:hypothetical protein